MLLKHYYSAFLSPYKKEIGMRSRVRFKPAISCADVLANEYTVLMNLSREGQEIPYLNVRPPRQVTLSLIRAD